jgi:hypothetical protein
MNASVAIQQLEQEGAPILKQMAQSEPAKVVAGKLGFRPRHVYNLREGETGIGWQHFILAAQHNPQLRELVAKWLGFTYTNDARAVDMLRQLRALAASLPEEGDRA